ncbi:hypothetical protein EV361DRAFT_788271 [Lentinula raphanica]|uniref:FHA domain-containing protein n=1 Tax=Lentinula raphanica TaxID=153919 RepID=A0AA38P3P3_9AGAR|nr:hypothetical protein EV360DRAFT_38281 [Lentinula raphanica]KAJ3774399.1 hypothetical protein FB446DRAFT_686227 [Lentinula raphanica]KAJ3829140.1 hypothetical protein F5880DRAFT_1471128 [Lentinula raphanica]KAJ3835483.1 hypothetical protein F5878DRAFT_543076 [Lentinula raphanica]KAJ3977453.1 hypothetical protein EV361DRAFT_788271 [Lentinula raphanica]
MLALKAKPESFPFASKYIPLPANFQTILGSQLKDTNAGPTSANRSATSTNGWFAPLIPLDGRPPVSSLSLSPEHAQIWCSNGIIYIQDLGSAFGTYVNGSRISGDVALKDDDTLTLGVVVERNANTPADITDEHLLPVVAKVTCVNVPSRSRLRA